MMCITGLLASLFTAVGSTWTVDNDQPADFATIGEAIASATVAPGDTLLVYPGSYPSFVLDKSLQILAQSGSTFSVPACEVRGVRTFTLAGMNACSLEVVDVTGRGRIDGCDFSCYQVDCDCAWPSGDWTFMFHGRSSFTRCRQLVVTRSSFWGMEGCYPEFQETHPGAIVTESTVAFVDCSLTGGYDDVCNYHPTDGEKPALEVRAGSDVTLAATTLRGGSGTIFSTFGASALYVEQSVVRVRGSSFHEVRGGWGASGQGSPVAGAPPAEVKISGVTLGSGTLPGWVVQPDPPEPYVRLIGDDTAGGTATLELYGPAAQWFRVASSLHGGLRTDIVPGADPLWMRSSLIHQFYAVQAVGQDIPATLAVTLNPDWAVPGSAMTFQAFRFERSFPFLTNPDNAVVRW